MKKMTIFQRLTVDDEWTNAHDLDLGGTRAFLEERRDDNNDFYEYEVWPDDASPISGTPTHVLDELDGLEEEDIIGTMVE